MSYKEQIQIDRIPRHVAIIMDGNGRWAKRQGMARMFGHRQGVETVHRITEVAAALGIDYLTLYAFSTENWNRPKEEVDALMSLLVDTIAKETPTLMRNNIQLLTIGDLDRLPDSAQAKFRACMAETSGNTGLKLVIALSYSSRWEIIRAAKERGADCVKIQTYTPDTLTIDCHNQYFQVENGTWEGENLYSLYGKAYTPWEWQKELKEEAHRVGIDFFSTPFDKTSVDFLEEMGVEFYKIASFEMIDLPLLKYVASKGKPIIMSTGMGSLEEIKEAVEAVYETGNRQLALLKCSSAYPAIPDDMHLKTIVDMKERFDMPVGLSDHSMGHLGAATAVAMGANIIEKHFCISREIENPDASFSMNPAEFKEMVNTIRQVEKAKGRAHYGVSSQEENSLVFRRSVFAVADIKKGERFTEENTRIIRPGYGEKPKYLTDILGMKADRDIERGTPIHFNLMEKKSILFLTNNAESMALYQWMKENGKWDIILQRRIQAMDMQRRQ